MDLKLNGFSMAGGDGTQSYTKNSSYQRAVMDAAKQLVQSSIADPNNVNINSPPFDKLDTFRVADLGCSVGPNTFIAIDNILDAVKLKYDEDSNRTIPIPEFQVHFNDYVLNDFNTLFKSLPPNRDYHASGVPGSFHTRLFPRAYLHIAYSSYSVQWLSQVPSEIMDPTSPAYNKGRINCIGDNKEVIKAYSRQHFKDFSDFLHARALEIVPGGLVVLILPARPNGVHHSDDAFSITNDRMGACLMDLAKQGVIEEEKVDKFNLPQYIANPDEIEEIIKQNGHFDIERMEGLPEVKALYRPSGPEEVSWGMRAVMGELIKEHFGHEILDDVFRILQERLSKASDEKPGSELNLFILLKRKGPIINK